MYLRKRLLFVGLLLAAVLGVNGCYSDDDPVHEIENELNEQEFKEKVLYLAQIYGLDISFFDIPSAELGKEMSVESLSDIEELFAKLSKNMSQPINLKLYENKLKDGSVCYQTKTKNIPIVKTRSEIYTVSGDGYNFTDFVVTIMEKDDGSIAVDSDFTGATLFSYTQDDSSASVNGDVISFSIRGTLKAVIPSVVGIQWTHVVTASGYYDKRKHNGSVTVNYPD